MSDLHLEAHGYMSGPNLKPLRAAKIDLLLLPGDIGNGSEGISYAVDAHFELGCPVAMCAGNHEFYGGQFNRVLDKTRESLEIFCENEPTFPQVYFLERNELILTIRGRRLRVLGCTLWTDYALFGTPTASGNIAEVVLSDHRAIRFGAPPRRFTPADALQLHRLSRAWLAERFSEKFHGDTIVMTHHGVCRQNIPPKFANDPVTPAFVSDLSAEIRSWKPRLWATGHTHFDVDAMVGETRVVSRQRGYPRQLGDAEHHRPFEAWIGEI